MWRALGKLSQHVHIAILPQTQNRALLELLNRQGVLPPKLQHFVAASTPEDREVRSLNAQEVTQLVHETYEKGMNGRRMAPQRVEGFFRRCAEVCMEFDNDTLLEVLALLVINECRHETVLKYITMRIQLRLRDMPTHHLCTMLHSFCYLGISRLRLVRDISFGIYRRLEEITSQDATRALRGMALADKTLFDQRLFHALVGKVMEEVNEKDEVPFTVLQLVISIAAKNEIQIPHFHLDTLLRCSEEAVRNERAPRNLVNVMLGFVRIGVTSASSLQPVAQRLIRCIKYMDIVGINLTLQACARLDAPLEELIVALLARACDVIQQAHVGQCEEILFFLSQLAGASEHKLVNRMVDHVVAISDNMTPAQAANLLISFLRLQCTKSDALLKIARIVIVQHAKDFMTASAVARVCFDAGCRERVFLRWYHSCACLLWMKLKINDLALLFQTLHALQIEDPRLVQRIARKTQSVCRQKAHIQKLPPALQEVIQAQKERRKAWLERQRDREQDPTAPQIGGAVGSEHTEAASAM